METTERCVQLLKHYEGCELEAYKCSAGIWTLAYGNTFWPDGRPVKQGDTCTQQEAEDMLPIILKKFAQAVSRHMVVPTKCYEFDALVCFTYNIGIGAFEGSTLLRKFKKQAPVAEIVAEFAKWTKAKGKVLKGLVKRRAAEAWLFEHGEVKIF